MTGKDAGKKVPGRKRGLTVDALGLIIAVVVTAASVTDTAIGVRLLDKVVEHTPTVTRAWGLTGSRECVSSWKVTVPVGVAPEPVTVAVNVSDCPTTTVRISGVDEASVMPTSVTLPSANRYVPLRV